MHQKKKQTFCGPTLQQNIFFWNSFFVGFWKYVLYIFEIFFIENDCLRIVHSFQKRVKIRKKTLQPLTMIEKRWFKGNFKNKIGKFWILSRFIHGVENAKKFLTHIQHFVGNRIKTLWQNHKHINCKLYTGLNLIFTNT